MEAGMITGVMVYEDEECTVFVETIQASTVSAIDTAFKSLLDSKDGALIQLTYVDPSSTTIINSEGFPV